MRRDTLTITTGRDRFTDLTREVTAFVHDAGDGLCNVFLPHATAGIAIFEVGAGTEQDLSRVVDELLPRDQRWAHRHGSPGHGADHVLPAFLAPSITIPVHGGRLVLGTWQAIVLVDPNGDNATRTVHLSLLEA